MILKNCKYLVTQDSNRTILQNVDIEIEGNTIKRIESNIETNNANETNDINKTIIDCSNKIVLPGLINTHTHIGMHSLRGYCDDEELETWLKKIVAAEKEFSHEQIQENASKACEEMLATGTTTFVEMYTPIEPVIEGVKQHNIRAVLCPVIFNFLGKAKEQLETAKKLAKTYKNPLIQIGIGAHSVYAVEESTLKEIKKFAKEHNILTPIHLAETRKERFDCFDKHKKLPAEYLASINFLDNNTLLVHSIWLTKGEVRIIKKHNATVSHCPTSNMKLSSGGVTPLMEMFEENVSVGLGTDSVASNNNMDMFKEMMIAGLLHKQHRWDPKAAPVQKLLDMTTIDAAKALNMSNEIGSIEVGKLADIVTIEIGPSHWPLNEENVVSHLVYATNGSMVKDVLVDGKKAI
jgi:5-methylthioadenosine/S-adenosylhomocysteine deaminase